MPCVTFQLWDLEAGRLLGVFDTEGAALDAAYQRARARGEQRVAVRVVARPPAPGAPARRGWRALGRLTLAPLYASS